MSYEPVIGIDFGATYTKVAYRKRLEPPFGDHPDQRSQSVEFMVSREDYTTDDFAAALTDDDSGASFLIPSCIIRKENGKMHFGWDAAGMDPGAHDRLYINWKSELFREDGRQPEDDIRELAKAFFKWLRVKLGKIENTLQFAVDEAAIRICVPALEQSEPYIALLGEILATAGWSNNTIVRSSEPIANTVGYATQGRNAATWFGCDYGTMFHREGSFMRFVRDAVLHDGQTDAHLVVVDIGSFTSDLSVVEWGRDIHGYMRDIKQVSFRHGIVRQLDEICLPTVFLAAGTQTGDFKFFEVEDAKEVLYRGESYYLARKQDSVLLGEGKTRDVIDHAITVFCEQLIEQIKTSLGEINPKWFLLTGGGSRIQKINDTLTAFFRSLGSGNNQPANPVIITQDGVQVGGDARNETSIGACSIYWKNDLVEDVPTPTIQPLPLLPPLKNCSCQGLNSHCMRCFGSGVIDPDRAQGAFVCRRREPDETPIEEIYDEEDIREDDEDAGQEVSIDPEEITQHTLEGWMGELVFGSKSHDACHNYAEFNKILCEGNDCEQRAAWYRLFCLASSLGAKVQRSVIKDFWNVTLAETDFWEVTTRNEHRTNELDSFFEDLIHREFRGIYARDEQAELFRRVFYDFRKIRFLVYQDDFHETMFEVLSGVEAGLDPVKFIRGGWLPDGSMWRGVIGQSMASPILFLMREWRRMGLITSSIVDHSCFYMNGPARRAACRRGWLSWDRYYAGGIEDVRSASRDVFQRLQNEQLWDPMLFDIPLQIEDSRRRRP